MVRGKTWCLGWALCASLALPACGLTLDYDPPADGGLDADLRTDTGGRDAGAPDAPGPACRTDVDCDDGEACNGVELCAAGACVPGEAIACDDGDVCNGEERCAEGSCVSGTPLSCGSDGDPCNGEESCDPVAGCILEPALDCDDGVDCTIDACEAGSGCVHEPRSSLCTAGPGGRCEPDGCQYDLCNATTCVAGPCERAACSGATCVRTRLCLDGQECCAGACVPLGCDDGNACTADACGSDACRHEPLSGRSCSDGNPCTLGDACGGGACLPGPMTVACTDGNPCTADACDPSTGLCLSAPASGVPCSDGDACTTGDVCVSGACAPGTGAIVCPPIGPCFTATCDASGGCVDATLPPGTHCGTDRVCTAIGTCECRAGTADCDRDGSCECDGRCDASFACVAGCTNDVVCGPGQSCCLATGACYPMACLGCCMALLDAGTALDAGVPLDATTARDAGRVVADAEAGTGVTDGGTSTGILDAEAGTGTSVVDE